MKAIIRFSVSAVLLGLFLNGSGSLAATADKEPSKETIELWYATKDGDVEKIKSLIAQGADVNAKVTYGDTVLMEAVENGDLGMVEALLDKGPM